MDEPVIDPGTGKPVEPAADPPPTVTVPAEEWGAVKARLDAFDQRSMASVQPTPVAPAAPAGPTLADQVKEIDDQITPLNTKIDDALKNQQPISGLLNERDDLVGRRNRLQIKHEDIDPIMAQGIATIDQLSDTVTRPGMKHLDIVKDDFETAIAGLPIEQRMNPQMRQAAYDMAVGRNVEKIREADKEVFLREQVENPPAPGDGAGDGNGGGGANVPKPKDVLSVDSMSAMESVGKTPDQYYQGLGYKDWPDYWEKTGKEYFGDRPAA